MYQKILLIFFSVLILSNANASSDDNTLYNQKRLEAYNFPGSYVGNYGNEITLDINNVDTWWRIVPGLADASAISFQSTQNPDYYLRHQYGELKEQPNDETPLFLEDATFIPREGFADSNLVSLESFNLNNHFIRHEFGLLKVTTISDEGDEADATFRLNPKPAADGYGRLLENVIDKTIRIESSNLPGSFLKHVNNIAILAQEPNSSEQSEWRVRYGLSDENGISLELTFPRD